MASYVNKRGKRVELTVTRHAYIQFKERAALIFGHITEDKHLIEMFERIFKTTDRVHNLNHKEQTRQKRHGHDSMYFRTNGLTFIVQNSSIVTVEISDKGKRHLNNRRFSKVS